MRKICFVTGTRAEYGLLSRLMRMVKDSEHTHLQIIATNMHLSLKYGNTYQEIEKDGFVIDYKIPIIEENSSNDSYATVMEMSRALSGFADAYRVLEPDMIVVLGDRYEILAAVEAAMIMRIPIAHIHGGEITEGAYDDAIRHSITKMSHLHFAATEEYRRRIIQLGEQPDRVFYTGALGVENIKHLQLMDKAEIEKEIGFEIDGNTILVTYHPVTLGNRTAKDDIRDFLDALEERKDLRIVFTMPNSDAGGQFISDAINEFVADNHQRAKSFKSLGVVRYLSVMKQVVAVVGNSSSGLAEVPSFGIPTLNIGERQKGRIAAESVYNCASDKESILKGLDIVLSKDFRTFASSVKNPYEKANTAEDIFKVISTYPIEQLKQKHFYDI
ncbi:MAG: UDP-N-acetylglucosamine 2-epimerase (hydrolyzing) [Bacteroidales bacterium]|nr:UDP-N-acetylglucosamine 2-epimerase (hydrolyzing) [Bacteroidales bacterium]